MSTKKLDEASVAAMINGFLAHKKKKVSEAKTKAISQKKEAFWNSIVESVILEVDREDPDDWQQQLDFSQGGGLRGLEQGGFTVDDTEKDKVGVPVTAQPPEGRGAAKADQSHGKRAVTYEYVQRVVKAKLKQIREREPQLWAQFSQMDPKGQAEFKRKIWDEYRNKENLRKAIGAEAGSGRGNHQKRVEVVTNLAAKIFQRMAKHVAAGEKIPTNLSAFSLNMLGFDPNKDANAKRVLMQFANGEVKPEQIAPYVKTALEKGNASEILKFANTRLDMYPGDWQDSVEDKANKQGIPGSRDRERGIGTGLKTVYMEPKKGFNAPKSDKFVSAADDEIKKAVVQRQGTGNSPVYRMFKDFDLDDIMKYFDYYRDNPAEIDRARKERVGAPPQSLSDLTGKAGNAPDAAAVLKGQKGALNPDQEAEIGSRSASSILSKQEREKAKQAWEKKGAKGDTTFEPSLGLDPKDVLNRISDFGSDEDASYPAADSIQGRAASGLANVLSAKDNRIQAAKDEYHRIAELVKPLFVKQNVKGEELSPDEAVKLSQLTKQLKARRQEMEQLKQHEKVTPDIVADIMAKMAVRDAKGNLIKLQDPNKVEWDSEEEAEMGHRLFTKFDPKRLNVKGGDKDVEPQFTLKNFIPGFAAAEEEKVAANIPAQKGAKGFEKRIDDQDRAKRDEKAAANKVGPKLSLADIQKSKEEEQQNKDKLARAMLKRRSDLDQEKSGLDAQIGDMSGDRQEFEDITSGMKDLLKGRDKSNELRYDTDKISASKGKGLPDKVTIDDKKVEIDPSAITPMQNFKQMQDRWEDMMKLRNPASVDASIRGKKQGLKTSKDPAGVQKDIDQLNQIRPLALRRDQLSKLPTMQQMYLGPRGSAQTPSVKPSQKVGDPKKKKDQFEPSDLPTGKLKTSSRELNVGGPSNPGSATFPKSNKKLHQGRSATGKIVDRSAQGHYNEFEPDELSAIPRSDIKNNLTNLKKGDKQQPEKFEKNVEIDLPKPHFLGNVDDDSENKESEGSQLKSLRGRSFDPRDESTLDRSKMRTQALPKQIQSPGDFKYDKESPESFNKKLVTHLVADAKKKLIAAGEDISPERLMQHIVTNFTRGPGGKSTYPEQFNSVRDFFLNKAKDILGSHGLPRDLKIESKHSLLELLVDIGEDTNKHVTAQKKDGWDKAQPAKKLNMVPKWKKGKMKLTELFKGKDYE